MNAGWLRHRITIQKKVVSRSTSGAEIMDWQTHKTVWASVEPLRGREYLEARQAQASADIRIRMRYQAGITPEMQVVFGSRIFQIISVIDVLEKNCELNLMCQEILR